MEISRPSAVVVVVVVTLTLALASSALAQPSRETGSPAPAQPAPAPYPQPAPYAQPAPYGYPAPAPAYGYYPPAPIRPQRAVVGHRTVHRPSPALWATGIALFAAGWVLDFAVITPIANAISDDRPPEVEEDSWAWSLVPVVGPWIQLALEAPHPAIPVTLGLMQLAGVGMFIAGMVVQQEVRVPIYEGDPGDPAGDRAALSLQPSAGGGTLALVVTHR